MVLVDKVAMLLRLVHLNNPAAAAVKGMLYEAQRSYGSHYYNPIQNYNFSNLLRVA